MAGKPGTKLVSGTTKVATAQTPVQLVPTGVAKEFSCVGVWVSSDPSNTGKWVAVGDKNVNAKATLGTFKGILIPTYINVTTATQAQAAFPVPVFIEVSDPSELWVDVATSSDCAVWTIVVA